MESSVIYTTILQGIFAIIGLYVPFSHNHEQNASFSGENPIKLGVRKSAGNQTKRWSVRWSGI